jgi:ketosteroid isomerase-like protein
MRVVASRDVLAAADTDRRKDHVVSTDPTADELAIRNVLAAFALATDTGTVDDYMALLTDDAVIELAGRPPRNGSEELRAGAEAGRSAGALGPGSHSIHMLGASSITLAGDTASALTPFVFFGSIDDVPAPAVAGHYYDTFHRSDGGWRLAHRRMQRS